MATTQETAKTLYLTANNIKFAYRIIGPEKSSKPPILFLNHYRSNIDLWDPLVVNGIAAAGRQVITYDYGGVGHSGGDCELSVKAFSANAIAFLKELLPTLAGSPKQVDLLGFSLGGYVVQQLTIDMPEIVNRIVISGSGLSGTASSWTAVRPMAEVQSAISAEPADGQAIADAFFPSFINTKDASQGWLGRIFSGRAQIAGKDGEPEFRNFLHGPQLQRLTEAYLKWDGDTTTNALLQTIQKDTLVTAGSNDLIVPTQNAYALSRQIPRANFVVYPGSGHGHLFQYSDFYVKQVNSFLDGEWPSPPSYGAIRGQLGV
ncbi:Alpha beta hydrolase fold-1 [Fusarium albosuccineum]|uniref:Alpha beta hydrolase fold-1 n=1 Tax=Fusarium albosuccineum TaxID=1237068 RepID=A0A8H4LFU8_9HYPO|nr:Alpha beta hydrolase fold-1 [Fusarium albosuccineum]